MREEWWLLGRMLGYPQIPILAEPFQTSWQTPRSIQVSERIYTLDQGPNSSGKYLFNL